MRVASMLALIQTDLRPGQRQAIASFCGWLAEREGGRAVDLWEESAMLRMINAGALQAASAELFRWVFTAGEIDPTLVARRAEERRLWEGRNDETT
jgi:GH24 family phage-related lysozyme (muramidase)